MLRRNRNFFVGMIVGGMVLLSACGTKSSSNSGSSGGTDPAGGSAGSATVQTINTTVSLAAGSSSAQPVIAQQPVGEGDVLTTDASGLGEVDFPDSSLTRVGPNSTFTLTTLETSEGSRNIDQTLGDGLTYSRVQKLSGSESFSVSTGNATASVRGTTFAVGCLPSKACTFASVEDTVNVATSGNNSVDLKQGENVTVDAGGALGKVSTTLPAFMAKWIAENEALDVGGASSPKPAASPTGAATARLEGTFSFKSTVTDASKVGGSGFSKSPVGSSSTGTYVFTPTCASGPCDVKVEVKQKGNPYTATATFNGSSYTWSGGKVPLPCQDAKTGKILGSNKETTKIVKLTPQAESNGTITSISGTFVAHWAGGHGCKPVWDKGSIEAAASSG